MGISTPDRRSYLSLMLQAGIKNYSYTTSRFLQEECNLPRTGHSIIPRHGNHPPIAPSLVPIQPFTASRHWSNTQMEWREWVGQDACCQHTGDSMIGIWLVHIWLVHILIQECELGSFSKKKIKIIFLHIMLLSFFEMTHTHTRLPWSYASIAPSMTERWGQVLFLCSC